MPQFYMVLSLVSTSEKSRPVRISMSLLENVVLLLVRYNQSRRGREITGGR